MMIIHANVTIPKHMAAQIQTAASAVQIVRLDLPVPRVPLGQEGQLGHRAFPVLEVLLAHKGLRESPDRLALRGL